MKVMMGVKFSGNNVENIPRMFGTSSRGNLDEEWRKVVRAQKVELIIAGGFLFHFSLTIQIEDKTNLFTFISQFNAKKWFRSILLEDEIVKKHAVAAQTQEKQWNM